MKKNLRGKIREYIASEDGKVGVKSPLTLGVAAGGLLLAHAILGTPRAEAWECEDIGDCPDEHVCMGPMIWNGMAHVGTCVPE